MATLSFPIDGQDVCVRRVPGYPDSQKYQFYCPITSIPSDLVKWLQVNPRRAQHTSIHRGIVETIVESPQSMVIKNAGLIISAKSAKSKARSVDIELVSKKIHGLIDGNNTREAVERAIVEVEEAGGDPSEAYIEVSVYTGMNQDQVVDVASGQNIRKPVQAQSLLNFTGYFDDIKASLADRADDVCYCEGDTGSIDIKFLIQLLQSVNVIRYPDSNSKPMVYGHVGKCLRTWKEGYLVEHQDDPSESLVLAEHALAILESYEILMESVPGLWNQVGGKWGSVAEKAHQAIGLVMLQAMRPVVAMDLEAGTFEFLASASDVIKGVGEAMVEDIKEAYQSKRAKVKGADNVGKNPALYKTLYNEVRRWAEKEEVLA